MITKFPIHQTLASRQTSIAIFLNMYTKHNVLGFVLLFFFHVNTIYIYSQVKLEKKKKQKQK